MPQIFDNIAQDLLPALRQALHLAYRADFAVGYFNLRGWKEIDQEVETWPGADGHSCRLLVGMQRLAHDELPRLVSVLRHDDTLDNSTASRLRQQLAEAFRKQLTFGVPNNADEAGLRRLLAQLRNKKLVVKLYLRHTLHAKLYLAFRSDPFNPIVGFVGSSNLTLSGLSHQGELNVDVLDQDATTKLSRWFDDRWNDRWCVDISADLITVIEESWAREDLISPYHIYVKMAYHLAHDARAGLSQFKIPPEFGNRLFDYQAAAVRIAAHHLRKRGGVLIGDVVGLGKTLMATALAKVFQDDEFTETLIICPKNLTAMWQMYVDNYRLLARVQSITTVQTDLPDLRRYRVVLIDESHNLRNREGRRYAAIREYIERNDCKCILLSATPYNKAYADLSNQLRLFIKDDADLGIRPEQLLREIGEVEFVRRHQCSLRSLAAFEKSEKADDWRELMRLYLVRRTRSFIKDNYAYPKGQAGKKYLLMEDGTHSYFPERVPRTVRFAVDPLNPADQYARFLTPDVQTTIGNLSLPRYGLGLYANDAPPVPASAQEQATLDDLSRAGARLIGFCRTNLFKRLESSGHAFEQSVERHVLRNCVYLHAIENCLPVPIGTQDISGYDLTSVDEDPDNEAAHGELFADGVQARTAPAQALALRSLPDFKKRAAEVYADFAGQFAPRFKWLPSELFLPALATDLERDAEDLLAVLNRVGQWRAADDAKLGALVDLATRRHPRDKILVFTQFADTVRYLTRELKVRGVEAVVGVTGQHESPTAVAQRFSPVSNEVRDKVSAADEIRVLIATDVLSEGQNLQDAAIIVNFDLPWAIIRLIQRAGRVDRIGQKAPQILCYSFLPAAGVEMIIQLRRRVRDRLRQNANVVGTDEAFFEDDAQPSTLGDLYNEKAGVLDDEADAEVDLVSYSYQIWKNAIDRFPALESSIPKLPAVAFSARSYQPAVFRPAGVLTYLRTAEGNDALAWLDDNGKTVTESQFEILRAAECSPDTPALPRSENHHELVQRSVELIVSDERAVGGQLGRPSGARFKTYERLKRHAEAVRGTLFDSPALAKAIDQIYRFPLRSAALDTLNRQLRLNITDEQLAAKVLGLWEDDRLCIVDDAVAAAEPQIMCSLGLVAAGPADAGDTP